MILCQRPPLLAKTLVELSGKCSQRDPSAGWFTSGMDSEVGAL